MIRETLELLSRPLRRRRWNARRDWIIGWRNGTLDEQICGAPPPEIPCTWEERNPNEVRRDIHRYVESVKKRLTKRQNLLIDPVTGQVAIHDPETDVVKLGDGTQTHYSQVKEFLKRAKKDLKKKKFVGVEHPPGWVNPLANDEDGGLDMHYHSLSSDEE